MPRRRLAGSCWAQLSAGDVKDLLAAAHRTGQQLGKQERFCLPRRGRASRGFLGDPRRHRGGRVVVAVTVWGGHVRLVSGDE